MRSSLMRFVLGGICATSLGLCCSRGSSTSAVTVEHAARTQRQIPARSDAVGPPRALSERPSEKERSSYCDSERAYYTNAIDAILEEYRQYQPPRPIEVLVALDTRARELIESRPRYRPCMDDARFYDEQWAEVGFHLGYWVDLSYSGIMLDEAHRLDPHSEWRKYTLYTTVFGTKQYFGLGTMPDLDACLSYVEEFPDGPFAADAHLTLANFYKDLFMVLKAGKDGYKYDCFEKYVTKAPIEAQLREAKKLSLKHYDMVLAVEPANDEAAEFRPKVEDETVKSWSFCAD